jgi:2-dehydropantoate 2-reductase
MNIAVVGLGGVGGFIGARLCRIRPEHHITFIARGTHAETIKSHGITIVEDEQRYTEHPDAVLSAKATKAPFDLIFLCVKSYDIKSAIDDLAQAITPETLIIPLSNGVEHAENIRKYCDAKVLDGAAYILSHIEQPGTIRKKGNVFALVLGGDMDDATKAQLETILKRADLRYKIPDDIATALWKKYLFIAAFANLTSYHDMTINAVYETFTDEAQRLLGEIEAVARAKGIMLEGEVEKALATAASLPPSASTSMHLDFQNDRPTELETLSGYLVREAKAHGVSAPLLTAIYTTLKEKNHG